MTEDLDTYTKVCDGRFDRLEKKIDSINNKLDSRMLPLENFQAKIIGVCLFLSTVIPLVLNYLKS